MNNELINVLDEKVVLGNEFKIYGTMESPLFLAKDVAKMIENKNTSQMLKSIDEEEKVKRVTPIYNVYNGQYENQECLFLTEDGLYEVLMQSRKPIAKAFKKEVKAILKQMRLTGASFVEGREEEAIRNYFPSFSEEVKLAMTLDLKKQNDVFKKQLEEQKPKVDGYDMFINAESLADWNTVSKNFGIGRNTMLKKLREIGVLMENNIPYQRYSKYFEVKFKTVQRGSFCENYPVALVKPSGQEFLLGLLKEHKLIA